MADKRYVKPNPDGGWDVVKQGDRRTSVRAETQREAVSRARAIVRDAGGGEVRVLNRAGKIVTSATVARRAATGRGGRRTASSR